MCGIAGLLYKDPHHPCEADVVTAMTDIFPFRGPDDSGRHLDGPVGLGHRRLSIIDLGGGHQPMADARRTNWIVFNGEIYNFRELRQSLVADGHTFATHSDTEVILHLYASKGEKCVESLNGMFAFAIWDSERRSLFLARDRMGVKPLYYAETPEAFVFSSEIKSIFASGKVKPQCREEALAEYVLFRQVAGSETMFRGVMSLPPGCTMTVRNGRTSIQQYWSPRPPAERAGISYDDARQSLTELLEDSVRMRLVSDVPVGTFCSGGVDSSLVTAIAAKLKGDPVNTFSVGFDEPDFDESEHALAVSRHCGTIHHQLRVGNEEFSDLLPQMVWHNDEPLDFANSIQIFALSRLAKNHVTVVLTGEGSDELFAGYPRYRIPGLVTLYRRVPALLRRIAGGLTSDHRLAKLERYASVSDDDVMLLNSSYLPTGVAAKISPMLSAFRGEFRRACLQASAALALSPAARTSLLDQETFLVGILQRQDRMSMAASIESRVPFMDYRIVEFANRLPDEHKLRRGVGKAIVKDVARTFLPSEIVDRRKSGFGVPLGLWFKSNKGLGARISELAENAMPEMFDRTVLRRMVSEHRSGAHDHSELLWTALNLATWREAYRV
jgi:asparagine synthase (glutamine-hydrolysing)